MSERPAFVPTTLEDLPCRFADFVAKHGGETTPEVWLGAALASQESLRGGVCLDLTRFAGRPWPDEDERPDEVAPDLDRWIAALRNSSAVGRPGEERPLVLADHGRLYLHRYWEYEATLAFDLACRAANRPPDVNLEALATTWKSLPDRYRLSPGQRVAAVTAALRGLAVISGGAGTGKTTIVACMLRLLAAISTPARPLRVRLAAPTGKAAGRLKEQLRAHRGILDPDGTIDTIMRDEPATLHRLLGGVPGSTKFLHDESNPLPLDVLVIDETSMVDLPTMTKVVRALPTEARLVLIGDKDQLPPVGVGSVFGELCTAAPHVPDDLRTQIEGVTGNPLPAPQETAPPTLLSGSITILRESFRFREDSGIGNLADAVRAGDRIAFSRLVEDPPDDLHWIADGSAIPGQAHTDTLRRIDEGYEPFLRAVNTGLPPENVLDAFNRFRVLCVLRDGPSGVTGWNAAIESHLRKRNVIRGGPTWYEGRPVIVTRNDYGLRLWNGDVGVALRHAKDDTLRVYFVGADGDVRDFPPGRLPLVETAFALTVHKSQGSEFTDVLLALPDSDSRLLTRELLYTGVTRARERIAIHGNPQRFETGLTQRVPRTSGLADALDAASSPPPVSPAGRRPIASAAKNPDQGELF